MWESDESASWTVVVDEFGDGILHDGTDVVMTRAADSGSPYDGGGRWVSTPYGDANYGEALDTISGAPDAGDFPALDWRLSLSAGGIQTWIGIADPTRYIELDTASGDALLKDESGTVMGQRLGGSLTDINGAYPATVDGQDTYNAGAAWTYTVATTTAALGFEGMASTGRAATLAGVVFVTVGRDAPTDEATGITGPSWAAALPANTSTEVHFPVAEIDAQGVPHQVQTGAIQRPQP